MIRRAPHAAHTLLAALLGAACASAPPSRPGGVVQYVGSSTIAGFLRDAESTYGAVRFELDTEPESTGGERAILAGATDLAGIARDPATQTLGAGVTSTLIGRDAIAVIVHTSNRISNLSKRDLRRIFTGAITNWSELGGDDVPIEPCIMSAASATQEVFAAAVLGDQPYAGCLTVDPDPEMLTVVAATPGAIGHISFSFLDEARGLRAVAIDGEPPRTSNFDYPIARPLHLLWRKGDPVVEAFVNWTQTPDGQRVVQRRFVGRRVVGSVRGSAAPSASGTLVVRTRTQPYYDGGIEYYPHRPYEILTTDGVLIRRILNHRGDNDEEPSEVRLTPGTYLVRVGEGTPERPEFLVTIETDLRTEIDVPALLGVDR